jgi:hypothetical protein
MKKFILLLVTLLLVTNVSAEPLRDSINIHTIQFSIDAVTTLGNDHVTDGVDLLDKVLNLPKAETKVSLNFNISPALGHWDANTGEIVVSPLSKVRKLTTIHEVGHFIQDEIVLVNLKDDKAKKEYNKIFDKIEKTNLYKDTKVFGTLFQDDPLVAKGAKYLLNPKELWARAFSQYIVKKSKDEELGKQFKDFRSNGFGAGQWSDKEFGPVYDAIDTFFKNRDWFAKSP